MIFFLPFFIQVISTMELEQLDIDAEFSMSDIQDCESERFLKLFLLNFVSKSLKKPTSLMMRRPPTDPFNGTGEAMAQKVYEMAFLYQKHRSQGLTQNERQNLLGLRKLMQLKTMVSYYLLLKY